MNQEVTGPADAAATLPLSSTCGALPLSSTHDALSLSNTHDAPSLSNTHESISLSNTHNPIPLSNTHESISLSNTHNPIPLSNTHESISLSNTHNPIPLSNTHESISLSNTHNPIPLSNNHDALSLSNTHNALSLSNTHEAVSLSNTHNPIPLSNAHIPIPLSNTHEAVSLSNTHNPIPLSNTHIPIPLSNTHNPIPLSNTHNAVSLSNTHNPIPLSNTHNPIPLSNTHNPIPLSNTHDAVSLSNTHNPIPLSNTHNPIPLSNTHNPIPLSNTHNPIPLSNTHNPIPLSNTHNPIPLSNTHDAVSLSNTHNPIPLSNTHDVNCNETLPCFSVRLNSRTQATDNSNLNFHYPLGGSDYEEEEEEDYGMPGERWTPLGADLSRAPTPAEPSAGEVSDRLQVLEEEQDQLNSSLLALTSHFAQVQFRLKQIVSAEPAQREVLLKELENFAFRGIPDVRKCQMQETPLLEEMRTKEHEDKMTAQKEKQRELITQLKSQLEDLETFAYESGHADEPPTSRVLEKQRVLLEEVRSKLHIDLQNFDRLSTEELREIVDNAVSSIVDPAKVKEKLIDQLKTQVVDLERFVQFLQGETDNPGPYGQQRCTCPGHPKTKSYDSDGTGCCGSTKARRGGGRGKGDKPGHKGIDTTTTLMRKALAVLQIYVFSQLGCGSQDLNQNIVKNTTTKGNHWGELREKLEVAVSRAVDLGLQQQERDQQWTKDCSEGELINSDAEEQELMSSPAVTVCVRKELATAIRDLIQHGLVEMNKNSGLVRIGCFSNRSADVAQRMHAWDLLVRFYDMKQGREYKESPARMLSQSFHLDTVGGRPITAKQTLLGAIDTVQNSNTPYPCGKDSYFKAFICHALNERKLVTWLRLLFRTQSLIDRHYLDWSYVAHTGFEDALLSLERLLVINFRLPVDVAVRSFSNIRDVF